MKMSDSPTFNPGFVAEELKRLEGGLGEGLKKSVEDFFHNTRTQVGHLESLVETGSPMLEDAQKFKKVHEVAEIANQRFLNRIGALEQNANAIISAIDESINKIAQLHPTESANEIRVAIRAMDEKQRKKLIENAMENDDQEVLAAVLSVNPMLSGMTNTQQESIRHRYVEKKAPDLAERKRTINKIMDKSSIVISAYFEKVNRVTNKDLISRLKSQQSAFDEIVKEYIKPPAPAEGK
ncbi:hypothetical protein [Thiomicrorhabdus indica]|uniref:hypothetical protein n=1 Tax=Thiomicrorhabdus indica TaxID=2267253 RepID=UPI002AA8C86D|nr:hypothetical protein [Thiomicrorhabdus indica]